MLYGPAQVLPTDRNNGTGSRNKRADKSEITVLIIGSKGGAANPCWVYGPTRSSALHSVRAARRTPPTVRCCARRRHWRGANRQRYGVATVLSMISGTPAACAISASAAMSVTYLHADVRACVCVRACVRACVYRGIARSPRRYFVCPPTAGSHSPPRSPPQAAPKPSRPLRSGPVRPATHFLVRIF